VAEGFPALIVEDYVGWCLFLADNGPAGLPALLLLPAEYRAMLRAESSLRRDPPFHERDGQAESCERRVSQLREDSQAQDAAPPLLLS
jgi:hypothetical protein